MRLVYEDRGSSLASSMVGALVGVMLLSLIAGGLAVFMNFYINVTAANAVTTKTAQVEQQLRNDVALATNIASDTADDTGFTAIRPSTDDSTCVETNWSFQTANGKSQLVRKAKTFQETLRPATNSIATPGSTSGASMCGGSMIHEHAEIMINDAGNAAAFTYTNSGGIQLTRAGSEMAAATSSGSPLLQQVRKDSTRIAGVTLATQLAASGNKSSDIKIIQYARYLEEKSVPMTSNRVATIKIGD